MAIEYASSPVEHPAIHMLVHHHFIFLKRRKLFLLMPEKFSDREKKK
jgi:hypothetical protein